MKNINKLYEKLNQIELKEPLINASIKALSIGSQFLLLILMAREIPKEEFGNAMLAFTIFRLMSLAIGSGMGSIVLYHVSKRIHDLTLDIRLTRSVTLFTILITIPLTFLFTNFSNEVAILFSKPSLAPWLFAMAPLVLFGSLIQITSNSLDARSKVTRSIIITEVVPNIIRLTGVIGMILLELPHISLSYIFWIASAIPWAVDALRLFDQSVRGFERLSFWDFKYAGWLTLYPLLGMQLQGIDMIIVGAFFSSNLVAEYSIASRIASLYPFLQQMVARVFVPRSGPLFQEREIGKINKELKVLRENSLATTSVMISILLISSLIIFNYMPAYKEIYGLLIIFSIPPLVRCAFVGIDVTLRMEGKGFTLTLISISILFIIATGTYFLHEKIGLYSLPVSMIISTISINTLIVLIRKNNPIKIFDKSIASTITLSIFFILLSFFYFSNFVSTINTSIIFLIIFFIARSNIKIHK